MDSQGEKLGEREPFCTRFRFWLYLWQSVWYTKLLVATKGSDRGKAMGKGPSRSSLPEAFTPARKGMVWVYRQLFRVNTLGF